MRRPIRAALLAAAAASLMFAGAGTANAEPAEGWIANPGTSVDSHGVVTLDSTEGGTSLENADLQVAVKNGDKITFEYQGECNGGSPRVYIQGGAYNTFDADPNNVTDEPACGTDSDGDGWKLVSTTVAGITDGTAGATGIVNDNPANSSVVQVRNLTIAGTTIVVSAPSKQPTTKENHGQCVKAAAKGGEARSAAAKSDCGKKHKKAAASPKRIIA